MLFKEGTEGQIRSTACHCGFFGKRNHKVFEHIRPHNGLTTEKLNKVESESNFDQLSHFSQTGLQTKRPGMTFYTFSVVQQYYQ
jgi:hypothetical protein